MEQEKREKIKEEKNEGNEMEEKKQGEAYNGSRIKELY